MPGKESMRTGLVPGINVDQLDIAAGMRELSACGWPTTDDGANIETRVVIDYALRRWARGEEGAAQRGAIDKGFHGIPLICWVRVLAAAIAGAEPPNTTAEQPARAGETR